MGEGLAGAEHPYRGRGTVTSAVLGRQHEGPAAVGDEAAVELVERISDQAAAEDVVDGYGVALGSDRVGARVLPHGDRHFGQLLRRRAVLLHVARGHEPRPSHQRETEGILEGGRTSGRCEPPARAQGRAHVGSELRERESLTGAEVPP